MAPGVSSGATTLRAAVLGANDGPASNCCLTMCLRGGEAGPKPGHPVGCACREFRGACSMALGEWLSVTDARTLARTQIAKEGGRAGTRFGGRRA